MGNIHITIATNDYDRTRAVKDGKVGVDGCDVTYLTMLPEELFFRAVRYAEFDVTELSFSTHMLQTRRGDAQYVGIPGFISAPTEGSKPAPTSRGKPSACPSTR